MLGEEVGRSMEAKMKRIDEMETEMEALRDGVRERESISEGSARENEEILKALYGQVDAANRVRGLTFRVLERVLQCFAPRINTNKYAKSGMNTVSVGVGGRCQCDVYNMRCSRYTMEYQKARADGVFIYAVPFGQ